MDGHEEPRKDFQLISLTLHLKLIRIFQADLFW